MVWFKVDDSFAFHAKVVRAGNAALGLWVRAGAWSAQQLTDGFVPDHIVTTLGTKGQAKALADVGLWSREDDGYRFHGWFDYQPTREQVEKDRAHWRDKKRKQRRGSSGQFMSPGDSKGDSPLESHRPVPSRPDPTTTTSVQGGSHVSSGPPSQPPLYSDRCTRHGNDPAPGPCGDCKDVRVANAARPPLTLVTDTRRCLVHDETFHTVCRGCRSDAIAADRNEDTA